MQIVDKFYYDFPYPTVDIVTNAHQKPSNAPPNSSPFVLLS